MRENDTKQLMCMRLWATLQYDVAGLLPFEQWFKDMSDQLVR
jgi:hypothetical protein